MQTLLSHNAKVYVAARNQPQSEETIRELKDKTGNEAIFLKLDQVAAEEFLSKETQLHVLINNAGVMFPPKDLLTADGYDLQFGTNVLGHHYFTKLLLPTLISTAQTSPDGKARVVTVASSAHLFGSLDFATFKDGPVRKKMSPQSLYGQSKYGNIVSALELAKRYGNQGIVSIALNPGNIRSDLQRYVPDFARKIMNAVLLFDTPQGALTQLYAGTAPEAAGLNGKYLVPWARPGIPRQGTQDPKLGQALWEWLEMQVKDV
ncbi:hypothetical protein SERLA73DRAFT_187598 [Serpula lacrymans var. lacrymans S7.3]|uniref:NAD(P)-binding protein n=3 Tax=Serpula lacrymans var. lacrymans TaxID=341189 RepID=F8Q9M2_SERL3|nr:uncharacterized protein SERLADRAFT_477282 [Serpula lacrymans var. lacrymans S7.9]EGN95277.1 hypothetical protein SERLA73DRAFT_187598 [Serpula lacrymans var. lacrymans S7.3]EGO20802.1 hypothetical protein SERLADRAFT_477282 [Serpula lacrymans var. lacrymans S7.9]